MNGTSVHPVPVQKPRNHSCCVPHSPPHAAPHQFLLLLPPKYFSKEANPFTLMPYSNYHCPSPGLLKYLVTHLPAFILSPFHSTFHTEWLCVPVCICKVTGFCLVSPSGKCSFSSSHGSLPSAPSTDKEVAPGQGLTNSSQLISWDV